MARRSASARPAKPFAHAIPSGVAARIGPDILTALLGSPAPPPVASEYIDRKSHASVVIRLTAGSRFARRRRCSPRRNTSSTKRTVTSTPRAVADVPISTSCHQGSSTRRLAARVSIATAVVGETVARNRPVSLPGTFA
jgi:hypothetical protein